MKKIIHITIMLFLTNLFPVYSQPDISYILPDIGAPGMNIYMEIISANDGYTNFGQDGFYMNQRNDPVWIELMNSADSAKIIFGPIVVSWNGRMISTQAFINPYLEPNDYYWDLLNNEFRIQFRVVVNGFPTNVVEFYIVRALQLGDIRGNSERVLGRGSLGKRSKRGVMIVDSLILANAAYTVSTNDTDPWENGNQGYLPFVLLSKGEIRGGANTKISVDGALLDAGPGGGGGGGRFCDRFLSSINGDRGGNGFTGGGPGGFNNATGGGGYQSVGTGTSDSGNGLNGTLGGKPATSWETAPGGTGHPFGESGMPCGDGYNCEVDGKYGGGSGAKQNLPGGSGGYGSDGPAGTGNNSGKIHGNDMVVPIAGGSGGSSGNPNPPTGNQCAGSGGGGGGAVNIFGIFISNIKLSALGGRGGVGYDNSHGGAGSGGYTGIMTKLGFSDIELSVTGGSSSGAAGGAGRMRYDSPSFQNVFLTTPAEASRFNGITTDTHRIVPRQFTLYGSRATDRNVRVFIKPESSTWMELSDIVYNSRQWSIPINLDEPDTLFYFFAIQEVPNPSSAEYKYEPVYLFSQAAGNIFIVDRYPIISSDTLKIMKLIDCPGLTKTDTTLIKNIGTADLVIDFNLAAFVNTDFGFELVSPSTRVVVEPDSSVPVIVRWLGQPGIMTNTLLIPHNDTRGRPNPWRINYEVNIDIGGTQAYDTLYKIELGDFYLGAVCPETEISRVFAVINEYSGTDITLSDPFLIAHQSFFETKIIGNRTISPGDTAWIEVKFKGEYSGINTYVTAVIYRTEECPEISDTVNVFLNIIRPELEIVGDGEFGGVRLGRSLQKTFKIINKGSGPTLITELPILQAPFRIVSSTPSIPPPVRLGPGEEIELLIEYKPLDETRDSIDVLIGGIQADSACSDTTGKFIFGYGYMTNITINTDSIYFGILAWCDAAEDTVVVKSVKSKFARIIYAEIEGIDKDNFSFSQLPSIPAELFTGDSVKFYIKFNPSIGPDGPKYARLVLIIDDESQMDTMVVQLHGVKEGLNISSDPVIMDFGRIPIGYVANKDLTLTNYGVLDRRIASVQSSNPRFSVTPLSTFLAGGGGINTFTVYANLTDPGIATSILTFIFDLPCADTFRVQVSADGLKADIDITNPLNFGVVAPCENKLDSIYITNTGETSLIIEEITLSGADAQFFVLSSVQLPYTLRAKEVLVLYVEFNPNLSVYGEKRANCDIKVEMNAVIFNIPVELIGRGNTGIVISPNPLNFGNIITGQTKTLSFRLTNQGPHILEIEAMLPLNSPLIFSVTPQLSGHILNPGEYAEFSVQFSPDEIKDYNDTLGFDIFVNSCPEYADIVFEGSGTPGDSVRVWFTPDTLVEPNLISYRHPIYVQKISSGEDLKIVPVYAKISFDASLFFPVSLSAGRIIDNYFEAPRKRVLEIEVDSVMISSEQKILTEIIGYTLLGEIDTTDFAFDDFQWLTTGIVNHTEREDGIMRIEICRDGGDRLMNMGLPMAISVTPNPADESARLDIDLLEVGNYGLEMVNNNGERTVLKKWYVGLDDEKQYSFNIDLKNFSSGIYYLILYSPFNSVTERLVIIK